MLYRLTLPALFALLAFAQPAAAQVPPPAATAAATVRVTLTTSAGPIVVALETGRAPITAGNFLKYVDQKRFDGIAFYRALKVVADPPIGFVQAGTQNDPKRVRPPIAHEPTSLTGLIHDDGALSMARYAPGTASGDFTIIVGRIPSMDADPKPGGDPGYAVFGHVVEGMDVVHKILDSPRSPTAGQGVMKGQMLDPVIRILTARRTPTVAP
ncbi:peptidylprolyl isomerase [soil metagenome]